MSKHIINAGATSQRFYIYLQDSTTGQGETGVTGATCYYLRDSVSGSMPAAVTLTFGAVFASPGTYPAWSSGQVREIGYMPGLYLIDIPDAVFAVGARNVVVQIFPTSGTPWLPVNLEFTLSAVSLFDSVRMGMTALPNATAGATGGVPLSVNSAGGVNTVQLGGTGQTGRDIGASVLLSSGTGAGQVNLSTGRIGINWADVINPTTTLALTGTTISTSQQVASVSGSVNSVATRVTANTDQWNGIGVTGMPMPTYTQPSGFLSASFPAGTIANTTNITGGTITTVSGNVNGSVNSVTNAVTVGTINNNVITAASIATDAIDADAIANSAITIRMSGDGTPSEGRIIAGSIANDVWNAATASYTTANTFGKLMDTLKKANFVIEGTTVAGSTTTVINTGLTGYLTDAFDNQTILFISGALAGTSSLIITSSSGGGVFTLEQALPAAPASGVDFVVLGTHVHGTQEIADVTWATDISGYTSPTAGYAMYQGLIEASLAKSYAELTTTTPYIESHADTLLGRNVAGGSNTGRLVKEALYALRNKSEIVGNTLNVYNETDGAIAWSATVASSAGANPVTGVDPA